MCFSYAVSAQNIDSLFHVFENSKGEEAYRVAVAIDETIGREPNFTNESDRDDIKLKLLRTMILYYYNNNDFQHVVDYSQIGIAHYAKIDDLFNLAGCYMTLANAYQRLGQLDKAIDCYNQCSNLMDQIGGEMAAVNKRYVINNIAEIHLSMDEYDRAEEMYHKCIEMLDEVDGNDTASNLDLATYSQNLAEVRIAQAKGMDDGEARAAKLAEAVDYAQQSLDLSQRYADTPHKIINRLTALAKADFLSGKVDEGEQLLNRALTLAKDNGEVFLESVIYVQKGQFAEAQGLITEAENNYARAVAIAEENQFEEVLQEALENAYLLARQHDARRALEYYERSVTLKDSIFNETQQQLIRDYQVRYAMQEKEHELQMQQEKAKRNRLYAIVLAVIALLLGVIAIIGYRLASVRQKRNAELRKLNETKDRLFSIVSHDVKAPVGAICTVLRQLNSEYETMSDTDRKASMVMLGVSAEALNERVNNIMQWVKGRLANSEVVATDFNLYALVNEVVKAQESAIGIKSLKVANEVPPDLVVHDDANVVSLVLQNLLGNAVKFSYPNGEVRIMAERQEKRVWVLVEDNGMGIAEKKLEKIFNFMTTSAVGTDGETGTGIGLFVSKQLMDRIGGEISIESVKGEGTIVKFSINAA